MTARSVAGADIIRIVGVALRAANAAAAAGIAPEQIEAALISAGLDEMPGAYKNIHDVMAAMSDLVDVVGRFDPKIVKMSDDGTNED